MFAFDLTHNNVRIARGKSKRDIYTSEQNVNIKVATVTGKRPENMVKAVKLLSK